MSKKREYDEVSVIRTLQKKNGIVITGKKITVSTKSTDLGNGSWGKIDYLRKVHKYIVTNENDIVSHNNHDSNRETIKKILNKNKTPKFNLADLTKSAMKNASATG